MNTPLRDRTVHSVLCAFWVLNDRYNEFVEEQDEEKALSRDAWMSITTMAKDANITLHDWHVLDCIITVLVLRCLGKLKPWRVAFAPGISDPDVAVHKVLQDQPEVCPSFMRQGPPG